MPYNLVQAGAAVGKSKTAILRAIRRGVISAQRDAVTGGWAIEPAELHRAFLPVTNATPRTQDVTAETAELRARLEAAELRITDRDALFAEQRATIDDLRRRLDTATEQLGEALQQVRLLTDQRRPVARSWWRWR
jgi:methylphosphotriester-DNA--protein-cysteine methyltransferase